MILLSEEHGLYGVEVPGEARDIEITNTLNDTERIPYKTSEIWVCVGNYRQNIFSEKGQYFKIIGTVSADTIDFDCEPYLKHGCRYGGKRLHYMASKTSVNDAFRSLIEAKTGKYFVNPYDKNAPWQDMKNDYEAAQQNLIQKMVILKKIT